MGSSHDCPTVITGSTAVPAVLTLLAAAVIGDSGGDSVTHHRVEPF
jgi:hypothetical protein